MTKDKLLELIDEFVAENIDNIELLEDLSIELLEASERIDETLMEICGDEEDDDTPEWMQ